ncbi:MAG: ABC transporter permease [Gemmatimonadaceae bacterium]|nr:ABC transporter permease [Gemmatimonadaceae bacterium]
MSARVHAADDRLMLPGHQPLRWRTPAVALLGGALLLGLVGPWIAPHDPLAIPADVAQHSLGPSAMHWLGTDALGRDIASRLLAGARYSIGVASAALCLATVLGVVVGSLAASLGRAGERAVLSLVHSGAAVPRLVVLIAAAGFAGASSPWVLVALLGGVSWFDLARLVHRTLRRQLAEDRVAAARALGVTRTRLLRVHLLPHLTGTLLVWASAEFGQLLLAETGLSFLGLGVPAPLPSWGRVLLETGDVFGSARWLLLGPGLLITVVVSAAFSVADRVAEEDQALPRL